MMTGASSWDTSALLAGVVVGLIAGAIIWFIQAAAVGGATPRVSLSAVGVLIVGVGVAVLMSSRQDGFTGGCDPYSVFAQNRWDPVGTAIRAEPNRNARQVGSFAPNQLVTVDGWVRTRAAYPSNTSPWDSDVWFHIADDRGWVAFAGVRADPTSYDPSGRDPDGGRPVPVDDECSGTNR